MFLVIDMSAILSTMYYGTIPHELLKEKDPDKQEQYYSKIMQTSSGVYTNAIYGSLRMLLKIVREKKPDYIAAVLDRSRKDTFRKELYADYKSNRGNTPEPLKQQFAIMEDLLTAIGIPVFANKQYEADDYAGSIIRTFENKEKMIFLTKDHDYMQLINKNVHGWYLQSSQEKVHELIDKYYSILNRSYEAFGFPDRIFEFTSSCVKGEEGVMPDQITDLKGLVGDKSDNIPGAKGIGPKVAIPLLNHYGHIEDIYQAIDSCQTEDDEKALVTLWKSLGVTRSPLKKFKDARDNVLLSKELATIKVDIPVQNYLEYYQCKIDENVLNDFLRTLEIKTLN